jgi:hypothetical protein
MQPMKLSKLRCKPKNRLDCAAADENRMSFQQSALIFSMLQAAVHSKSSPHLLAVYLKAAPAKKKAISILDARDNTARAVFGRTENSYEF